MTAALRPQIEAAAARADWTRLSLPSFAQYAGHARAAAQKAAEQAAQTGQELRIFTAGGDGTFMEAMTGARAFLARPWAACRMAAAMIFCAPMVVREEFLDLDAQLAGQAVPIDLMHAYQPGPFGHDLRSRTGCTVAFTASTNFGASLLRGRDGVYPSIVQQICGHIGRTIRYQVDDEVITTDSMMCAVCNGRAYGGGFCCAGSTAG